MAATTALEFQPPALSGFNHSSGWNLARFSTGNSSTAPVRPEHRLGPASPGLSPSQLGWHNNNATWWWYSGQSEGSSRVAGGLGRCSAPFSPRPPGPLFCHTPSIALLLLPVRHPGNGYDVMHEWPQMTVV